MLKLSLSVICYICRVYSLTRNCSEEQSHTLTKLRPGTRIMTGSACREAGVIGVDIGGTKIAADLVRNGAAKFRCCRRLTE
jgi:hypothetical protein